MLYWHIITSLISIIEMAFIFGSITKSSGFNCSYFFPCTFKAINDLAYSDINILTVIFGIMILFFHVFYIKAPIYLSILAFSFWQEKNNRLSKPVRIAILLEIKRNLVFNRVTKPK